MKKKTFISIIFLFLICIPIGVFASCSANCDISGGGHGNGAGYGSTPCTYGNCTKSNTGGVRICLYKSNEGKNPEKLGNCYDIWDTNWIKPKVITNPNKNSGNQGKDSDSIRERINCNKFDYHFNYNLSAYSTISGDTYTSQTQYKYTLYENLATYINNGTVANKIYDKRTKKGWLEDNVFKPMKKGKLESVSKMFGVSERVLKDNSKHMYISAELLTEIILYPGSTEVYAGTVGEIATNVIFTDFINHMYVRKNVDAPVGKLVNGSSNLGYKLYSSNLGYLPGLSGQERFRTGEAGNLCHQTYGMAIWYVPVCCPECSNSCDNSCGSYAKDSTERLICAKSYCAVNESDNAKDCVKACTQDKTVGCEDAVKNTCKLTDGDKLKDGYDTVDDNCKDYYTDNNSYSAKSRICYEDGGKYTFKNDQNEDVTANAYTERNTKYYKIDCTEELNLKDLPTKDKVVSLTKSDRANIYLGYTYEYVKTCDLKYRKANNKNKNNSDEANWTSDYDKSALKTDIKYYTEITTECSRPRCNNGNKETCKKAIFKDFSKNERKQMCKFASAALTEIKNVQTYAEQRLKYVAKQDYNNQTPDDKTSNLVDLSVDDGYGEYELVPIYCVTEDDTTEAKKREQENICAVEESKNTMKEEQAGNPSSTKCFEYKLTGTETHKVYYKRIYYALPSSYVASQAPKEGDVFHDKQECLKAVATANGTCIEKENLYEFSPKEIEDLKKEYESNLAPNVKQISRDYALEVLGHGSCGQFNYKLTCDYKFENKCEDSCKQFTPGSSDYEKCYEANCGCDAFCGSNMLCRDEYCPDDCEACLPKDEDESDKCDDNDECTKKCQSYSDTEKKLTCEGDCCLSKCGSNPGCQRNCCEVTCNEKKTALNWSEDQYNTCIEECGCPACEKEAVYRTIDMNEPFPNSREPGGNWFNKVGYITNSGDSSTKYYDTTDGKTNEYEYKIELTSDKIKEIKNTGENKVYLEYKNANSGTKAKKYCSAFINNLKLDIERTGGDCE